jgi:hypothetical protein
MEKALVTQKLAHVTSGASSAEELLALRTMLPNFAQPQSVAFHGAQ